MKFKVDESLPAEAAEILRRAGFIADTVGEERLSGASDETVASTSRSDNRILVTLDLDFANIRAYPPGEHAGIIVLRVKTTISPPCFSPGRQDHSNSGFPNHRAPTKSGSGPAFEICHAVGTLGRFDSEVTVKPVNR